MKIKTSGLSVPSDYARSAYNFELPASLIAQYPTSRRDQSRLYVLDRKRQSDLITEFSKLAELLPANSLLVANNSAVLPARMFGKRSSGGLFEFFLLTPLPLLEISSSLVEGWQQATAEGLLRPSKKIKTGETYILAEGLQLKVLEKKDFGQSQVLLEWQGSLLKKIQDNGKLPLPPYIRREPEEKDMERYQTIYANQTKAGSVAAPTAGLHFTPELQAELQRYGHDWVNLSLFVGYGTFSPVHTEDIREHELHKEFIELGVESAEKILQAKKDGRKIIAVGTTTTRALEGLAELNANYKNKKLLEPYKGWMNCFIYPGKKLQIIDGLITNFHLPETSLLMLVAALTGRERLLDAYRKAIDEKMRFFSYGDAMLVL